MRKYSGYLAAALAGSVAAAIPTTTVQQDAQQRLAVVVPAYVGDLDRAVSSLGRWPATCSPITQQNVDLVLYYAEGEEDAAAVDAAVAVVAETAGRCFSKTLTVYAHLSEEVRDRVFDRQEHDYLEEPQFRIVPRRVSYYREVPETRSCYRKHAELVVTALSGSELLRFVTRPR